LHAPALNKNPDIVLACSISFFLSLSSQITIIGTLESIFSIDTINLGIDGFSKRLSSSADQEREKKLHG